jgi:hypothetical protein
MVVTGVAGGTIRPGMVINGITGGTFKTLNQAPTAVAANTYSTGFQKIVSQVSGTPGGAGTYIISQANTGTAAAATGCGGPVVNGSQAVPLNVCGRRIRLDITLDQSTGEQCGFLDGVQVIQWNNPNALAFMGNRALCESPSRDYRVIEFGASAHLPEFATDGSSRGVVVPTGDFSAALGTALPSASWTTVYTFNVAYDSSGCIEVTWNPYARCNGDLIWMVIGRAGSPPPIPNYYDQEIARGTTDCRVPFSAIRQGRPGSVESISIFARSNAGTALLRDGLQGGPNGPRWRPAVLEPRIAS